MKTNLWNSAKVKELYVFVKAYWPQDFNVGNTERKPTTRV